MGNTANYNTVQPKTVPIADDHHRKLKTLAAIKRVPSITVAVNIAIEEYLANHHAPILKALKAGGAL